MKISPLDIQQKQFQPKWRGYDPDDVHTFLEAVQSEMESLVRDNKRLQEDLKRTEAGLEDYREREKSLKDTLIMAQKMTEDIKAGALKEAEIVLSEARLQSEQIVSGAHGRLSQVLEEIQDLKSQRAQMLASLRATIETHAKLLDISERQAERREALEDKLAILRTRPQGHVAAVQAQGERGR